jgi:hypothetical protein
MVAAKRTEVWAKPPWSSIKTVPLYQHQKCTRKASLLSFQARLGESLMRSDARPWHGGRVLVCDDNLLMAEVICDFLRECRLEMRHARACC